MRRNTPAVTRVDEWTRAETGVGAAIAAGSHLENGIWALLVRAARAMARRRGGEKFVGSVCKIIQWPWLSIQAIERRMRASPIRFVRAVIIPAASDFGFW